MLRDTNVVTEDNREITKSIEERIYPKVKLPKIANRYIERALDCFLNTSETKKKFGHYFIDGNELYYRTVVTERGHAHLEENLVAVKLPRANGTLVLGNSSALPLIGRRSAWGNEVLNRNETEVQMALSQVVQMIPFNVFAEAGLNLDTIQIVARGKEEKITRTRFTGKYDRKGHRIFKDETVHFTGASLFSLEGEKGLRYFLFDIDRREIKHKIFNAFLVELPSKAESIEAAYAVLKPGIVSEAEASGLKVQRQGEFFFIPVSKSEASKLDKLKGFVKTLELRTGNNRPNDGKGLQIYEGTPVPDLSRFGSSTVTKLKPKQKLSLDQWRKVKNLEQKSEYYFTGKVEHRGREHAALLLKGWYRVVPNTAQRSFTIRGEVD